METVTVILTTPEAQMFKDFQQFHEAFALMVKTGVFDIKYGKATLNFKDGTLENIIKEEVVYKR